MKRRLLAPAALVAVVALATIPATATAVNGDATASAFAVRTVRLLVANRYGDIWRTLHPAHQRVVGGRARYVDCELRAPFVEPATSVVGVGVRNARASIAGIGRVASKAVTIEIDFGHSDGATAHTVHVLNLRGNWRWVLPRSRFETYRRGAC